MTQNSPHENEKPSSLPILPAIVGNGQDAGEPKRRFLSTYDLTPEWEHVRSVASRTSARFLILRLAKFASLHGIAVGEVDEGVLTRCRYRRSRTVIPI